ncbi:MAG: ribosomal-protein-alanine N-acetyltransferase [Rhizobiales bacterium]|nr:ribosomal-protein-alanine N-acetyltransferase [Hyphomicrobiales bacterium]
MTCDIQPAGPAHAGVLAALHAQAFDSPWDEASFAGLLATPGAFALLAFADDMPLGFVLTRCGGGEAEILTICVASEARGKGIGHALMAAAKVRAGREGADQLFLEVANDNQPAIALYRACGFVEVGRRAGYYQRGHEKVDALVWRCDLGPAG